MAFAIFYNREDATRIAAEFSRSDLKGQDKSLASAVWNGGLKNWNSAPFASSDANAAPHADGDPDCRFIVVTGVALADFIAFLRRMSANAGAEYLAALADDMSCYTNPACAGAVEPWPPA